MADYTSSCMIDDNAVNSIVLICDAGDALMRCMTVEEKQNGNCSWKEGRFEQG